MNIKKFKVLITLNILILVVVIYNIENVSLIFRKHKCEITQQEATNLYAVKPRPVRTISILIPLKGPETLKDCLETLILNACNSRLVFYFGLNYNDTVTKSILDGTIGLLQFNNSLAQLATFKTVFVYNRNHETSIVTNILAGRAVNDYYDDLDNLYLFRYNDDTIMKTRCWDNNLVNNILSLDNIGVTGPVDLVNTNIITHPFVHYTHIKIFGYFFPLEFKNAYNDDWITLVYRPFNRVLMVNNTIAQHLVHMVRYDYNMFSRPYLNNNMVPEAVSLITRALNTTMK